ncbi:MAG: hypothetical protein JSS65_10895 [Armatimonadetes bacterium]|nr:hypothetical protein [Armatimonadota bacterium]
MSDALPDFDHLRNELEVFELMIPGYVGSILRAARLVPDDKWNWSFVDETPTPRETVEHTFAWLWCDRQQMTVPDWSQHQPVPNLPEDRLRMIAVLEEEAMAWRSLIRSLQPSQLDEELPCWDGETRLRRSYLFHMGQNVVYKAGQMWVLAFGLGLDGAGLYKAPFPDEYYPFGKVRTWPAPRNPASSP